MKFHFFFTKFIGWNNKIKFIGFPLLKNSRPHRRPCCFWRQPMGSLFTLTKSWRKFNANPNCWLQCSSLDFSSKSELHQKGEGMIDLFCTQWRFLYWLLLNYWVSLLKSCKFSILALLNCVFHTEKFCIQ